MNARPIGQKQPRVLHPLLTTRVLCVALAGLVLALALFLLPPQPAFAQSGSIACLSLTVSPSTMKDGAMGASYSQGFTTVPNWSCCTTPPFVYSVYSGSLPTGVTLSSSGTASGTPVRPGSYTFTLKVEDSGSKPNGYHCEGYVYVTITGTNTSPSFTAGPNVTVPEDAASYSAVWATNISPGGSTEAAQVLTFTATNDNTGLFLVQPAIAVDGTLSFTLKPNANGVANVSVYLKDNGGTANGGSDSSTTSKFKITVTPVEDPQPGPTYTVNSVAWSTDAVCGEMNCTFREAIDVANKDGVDSTIQLATGAVYTLQGDVGGSAGLPSITSVVTIDGHGAIVEPSTAAGMPAIRMLSVPSGGTLTLNDVEIRNFKSITLDGGALYVDGTMTIKNSTLHDNSALSGAAIYKGIGYLTIANCTFSNNTSLEYGGAIQSWANKFTLLSSTFIDNTSPWGAAYWNEGAPVLVKNNLLLKGMSSKICGWEGSLAYASNGNMSDDSTCQSVTKTAAEINLGPLAANGGPTPTMALLAGSSAIDVGNAAGCADANINGRDQRRYNRVADGNGDSVAVCDVGAYEYNSTALPPTSEKPDNTPPEVKILLTPAQPNGSNGWYRGPVTVDPQASDESGIQQLRCMLDQVPPPTSFNDLPDEPCPRPGGGVVTTDGEHTVYAAAKDIWNNTSEVVSVRFKIDATPPFITCPMAGPFVAGTGGHSVGPAGVDASVSGLDKAASTLSGTVPTDAIGPQTLIFKAVDLAGNQTLEGCAYLVTTSVFGGFYPPVKSLPEINAAKAGSAVPVKFSLGGVAGLNIFAPGYPVSGEADCAKFTPTVALQATASPGKSGLSYDPATGRYNYEWKTDKAWAGKCRVLVLKLVDGTEHAAYFKFK